MLNTVEVSREALFSLRCNLQFALTDIRARAQTAREYGDKFSYWTAEEDYKDTIRLLSSPVFSIWGNEDYQQLPTWTDYITTCNDEAGVVVFSDGSTIDDTVDVPF